MLKLVYNCCILYIVKVLMWWNFFITVTSHHEFPLYVKFAFSLRIRSHRRQKWPKSDFLPISEPYPIFLWQSEQYKQICFFKYDPGHFIGLRIERVWCFEMLPQSNGHIGHFIRLVSNWNMTDSTILCWRRRNLTRSMFTSVNMVCCMWCHIFLCTCRP